MKLKMSEKSLFAILLRSPWWVSLLIVAAFVLVSGALLPAPYVAYGVIGGFPFLVIALIAAWRQRHAPSAARLAELLAQAGAMSWREFALRVEQVFVRQGYTVMRLEGESADFRLERRGQATLLSCRRWKAANHGVEALRSLQAACEQQGARGVYLSLGPVSGAAERQAKAAGIELLHGPALGLLLAR
jgi:restriction system protein